MLTDLQISIEERIGFAEGTSFAAAGAYERLTGRVRFRVDPNDCGPNDCGAPKIVDLDLAPRDGDGRVVFSADLCILKPVDSARGNGRLLFDYGNRGNKRCLQFFNDAPVNNRPLSLADAGNGFLMRRGYCVVWLGWQGDLYPGDGRMLLEAPLASQDGAPITGQVRVEYTASEAGVRVFPLSGLAVARSYPTTSLDTGKARLTRRRYADSQRQEIPASDWAFARLEQSRAIDGVGLDEAIVASDSHIFLPGGFEQGWIYELIYEAKDPLVLGLGHLAVRDLVSFLKREGAENPLGRIEKAYAWGRSQTGRAIRDFLYLGFNVDTGADRQARRVFDGVLPHVAGGGKMWLNHRFALPTILPGQEYENHEAPVDRFPFSYAHSTDHLTGREDAILTRPESDPLVIHTDSATEYWQRRASLVHTDSEGRDLPQPDGVRLYLWSSSQHYAAAGITQPTQGKALHLQNPVATSAFFRANLDNLDRWASEGKAPPPSRVPLVAEGSLVPVEHWRAQFPKIPGRVVPRAPSQLELLDYGPDFDTAGVITMHPPGRSGRHYPILVPQVDLDGQDLAGVHAPMVQAPLGTALGWNLRQPENGLGALLGITGAYLPFPFSDEEALQSGDPRRSVLARYPDAAAYVAAIRSHAETLVAEGLLLEEDVARAAAAAERWAASLPFAN